MPQGERATTPKTRFGDLEVSCPFFNIYFPNGGRGPEFVKHKLAFYRRFLQVAKDYMDAGTA